MMSLIATSYKLAVVVDASLQRLKKTGSVEN